jgi:4-amino-4-deoxy-L-arabinose transferase-like glycosyltransferase
VHNARNRALWGAWQTDAWNPMYIAPVFTALEYGAFEAFGVGTWQARLVPVASGLAAVLLLMLGLSAVAGPRVALVGGTLAATNYIFVMWNRAALMESTMTALIVASWAAYAQSARRPVWGIVAGVAAVLAFFTKAAAAFFVAALALDALATILANRSAVRRHEARAAWMTVAGLAGAALAIGLAFVLPHWQEYQFYNWEMTVTRKPSYGLRDLIDRGKAWVKVSGAYMDKSGPPDYPQATAIARSYVEAAPERCLWGSDWPHPGPAIKPDDAQLFDLLTSWAPDDATRERILVTNPEALYGFPKSAQSNE